MSSLFAEKALSLIGIYKESLNNFTEALVKAKTLGTDFTSLMTILDPIFNIDKDLQDTLRPLNAELQTKTSTGLESLMDKNDEIRSNLAREVFQEISLTKLEIEGQEKRLQVLRQIRETLQDPDQLEATIAQMSRITLTSQAPPGWSPNKALILHRPPYPTEDLMRASFLFQRMNVKSSTPAKVTQTAGPSTRPSRPPKTAVVAEEGEDVLLDLDLNPDLL